MSNVAIPDRLTSLEELDSLCNELARLCRSKALIQIVFLFSLIPLVITGFWIWPISLTPGQLPALTAFCGFAIIFGSALVRIPGRWRSVRRFCRRLALAIKTG